jgi:glycosyltransferase involved in cell wall biosynthesis
VSKIKILIADAFLFPGGGQEKVVLQLLKLLDRNKFEVFFATGDNSKIPTDIPGDVQIFRVGFNSKYDLASCFKIRKIVRQYKIQVINVHGFRAALLIRFAYLINRRVKIVYTGQVNYEQLKQFSKSLSNQLSIVIGNFLDSSATDSIIFVSNTNLTLRSKQKPKIDSKKLSVIYNGVNPHDFNLNGRVKAKSGRKIIVTLSALVKRKGVDVLINAIKILTEQGLNNFEVRIGGEGPEKENLKKLITDYKLEEKIKMLGYVNKEDLLSIADIFVLPTYSEGLPLSIIEAGLFSVPVIASSVDGIPEIIQDKVNGLLVNAGSAEELAEAIRLLLQNDGLGYKLASALKNNAHTKFSERGMIEKYSTMFEQQVKV